MAMQQIIQISPAPCSPDCSSAAPGTAPPGSQSMAGHAKDSMFTMIVHAHTHDVPLYRMCIDFPPLFTLRTREDAHVDGLSDYRARLLLLFPQHPQKKKTSFINPRKHSCFISMLPIYMSNHTCHFGLGDDPKFEFDMEITLKKHHERRSALKLEGRYSPTRTIRTFPNVSPFAIPSPSESGATK